MEIPNKFSSDLALEIFRISTGRKRLIFLFFSFFFVKRLSVLEGFSPCPKEEVGDWEPGMAMALQKPLGTVLRQLLLLWEWAQRGWGEQEVSQHYGEPIEKMTNYFGFAHLF